MSKNDTVHYRPRSRKVLALMHGYMMMSRNWAVCGQYVGEPNWRWLMTNKKAKVTCGNCRRTKVFA